MRASGNPHVRGPGPDAQHAAPQHRKGPQSQAVHCPFPTLQEVDWEVELAVVIGKKGKHIKVRWKGQCQYWHIPWHWEVVGTTCFDTCLAPLLPPLASSGY